MAGRGSIVSGWHYQPLQEGRRAERDVWLRLLLRAARVLAAERLVRCTDFAFEQRVEVKRPTGKPGLYRCEVDRTLAPEEGWLDQHPQGTYRVEISVQVQQGERAELDAMVREAAEATAVGRCVTAERSRRRRRKRDAIRREELARILALFRRPEPVEER